MKNNNDSVKTSGQVAAASPSTSRRTFLAGSILAAATPAATLVSANADASVVPVNNNRRELEAFRVRSDAAASQAQIPASRHPDNGDLRQLTNGIGSFTKGLPHDALGEVEPGALRRLKRALRTGNKRAFESVPMGGVRRLANPQATFAFSMEGVDSHKTSMPAAPAFSSRAEIAEIVEVYWHALLRDVPFSQYATHPLVAKAVDDLNRFGYFRRRYGGAVTPENLFRGETPGDLAGPYISQFLMKPVPFGATTIEQRYNVDIAGLDFMSDYHDWLEVQRGNVPGVSVLDSVPRYVNDGRRLGTYVHTDFTYQAYLNAAQIIMGGLGINPWVPSLPYQTSSNQGGFVTFGGADILSLIAKAAHESLKAAWFHKWQVHLRLRPETFGGRIQHTLSGTKSYPLHRSVNRVQVFDTLFSQTGNYLLPMAYPEGSPTHPAYPAGHATIAGACTTVMKAFFDESAVIPNAVIASADGTALEAYDTAPLTIGGELNKLASNIALGRDIAGVHWRTDGTEGLLVGEQVAIGILRDIRRIYHEAFDGFEFVGFEGNRITV